MARQVRGASAHVEYSLLRAVWHLLKALPLHRAVGLGVVLGSLTATLDHFNRPVAMRNLEIAFPRWTSSQRLATLRAMYRNWGRMAAEWCHLDELTPETVRRFVHYQGVENWQRVLELAKGRGGFIFTGHFGNFELLIVAHALLGQPVSIVHRPLRNPLVDSVVRRVRTRVGNHLIERKGAATAMVSVVRRAGVVAIPIDLDVRQGVFVDFFSLQACTTTSLARLAIATGTPAVPGFIVREGATLHHPIVILPPFDIVREGDRDEAIPETTQRATRMLEDMIRQYPDHWNWIHRRWKTRPPGEARFY
jgi:KDO2-lipid IV(A) lauroyltransferase